MVREGICLREHPFRHHPGVPAAGDGVPVLHRSRGGQGTRRSRKGWRMTINPLRQLSSSFFALVVLVCIGTAGYILLEGWPFLDALYMTVTTISTVGFMEVHALSRTGRLFTM